MKYTRKHMNQMAEVIRGMKAKAFYYGDYYGDEHARTSLLEEARITQEQWVKKFRASNELFDEKRFRDTCER